MGKNKSDVTWEDCVWSGIKLERGESIVRAASGVAKARDFKMKPEEGVRWGNDGFDGFKGVPWELYPGAGGGFEITFEGRTAGK